MAGITGQGTTFNLPNFVGELFAVTPTDTPFLSAIGGLTGGRPADATLFQWQGYDLRDAADDRQRLEGADAPTAEERVRFNVNNVVEVHQEAIEVSYTKLAATGQFASTGSSHTGAVGINGSNPVLAELDWQTRQALVQIARDVERSFITGTFNNPATNATARRTRGILEAIETNAVTPSGGVTTTGVTIATNGTITKTAHSLVVGDTVTAENVTGVGPIATLKANTLFYVKTADANTFTLARSPGGATITFSTTGDADVVQPPLLTEGMILDLLQNVWDSGGMVESDTAALLTGSPLKRALTKVFVTDAGYEESSRVVGGVHVQTIETDFGVLNIILDRHMPSAVLAAVSLEQCAPRLLPIPDKGFLFAEPLAKVGAADRVQIYGEIGLEYGNEKSHGKLVDVSPVAP